MQLLLNLMIRKRQLTVAEYDQLLKYLKKMRKIQYHHEETEPQD